MAKWMIGLAIGLVIGLILVIIMHYTIFKRNNRLVWLYVIIILTFAAGGAAIQGYYWGTAYASIPDPSEIMENLTNDIADNWKNTNGGFDFEQIQTAKEDDDTPLYDDQAISLKCYDYGDYICFGYKDGNTYQNILFYKSQNGLILDGVIGVFGYHSKMVWFLKQDLTSYVWYDCRTQEETTIRRYRGVDVFHDHDNYISLSSRQVDHFYRDTIAIRTNKNEAFAYAWREAEFLTAHAATDNFIKFGQIEIVGSANMGYKQINGFYNYLYEAVRGKAYNKTYVVDASDLLCLPIPVDQQVNYPIAPSKQEAYKGATHYGVYNCTIAVNVNFVKGTEFTIKTFSTGKKTEVNLKAPQKGTTEYFADLTNKGQTDKIQVEKHEQKSVLTNLTLKFKDSRNSDLTGLNMTEKPVTITFTTTGADAKKVKLTSLNEQSVLLLSNHTYNYTIESEGVMFENFHGSFTLGANPGAVEFNYYYMNDLVVATFRLNPVGTIDIPKLDLANHPVRIVLTNKTDSSFSYSLVWNDNSTWTNPKSQAVKLGTYEYIILSDQLDFASTTGELSITTTNFYMMFNCALLEEEKNYTFTAALSSREDDGNYGDDMTFTGLNLYQLYAMDNNSQFRVAIYVKRTGEVANFSVYKKISDIIEEIEDDSGGFYPGYKDGINISYGDGATYYVQAYLMINNVIYTSNLAEYTLEYYKDTHLLCTLNFSLD